MIHSDLTRKIIGISFEVMNELGIGFLESVYHNALCYALRQNGLLVDTEVSYDVYFRNQPVGHYRADLVVEKKVVVEVKAVEKIVRSHKAQVINYLSISGLQVGLIINFGEGKVETKRVENPKFMSPNNHPVHPVHPVKI